MSEQVVGLAVVGQLLRRRWRLLTVLALIGAVAGVGASAVLSPGYESSTKVLVDGPRDSDALLTETQIVMSRAVLDRTAESLDWPVTGDELAGAVSAAVLDGNVLQILAQWRDPDRAVELADRVTAEYVGFSRDLAGAAAAAGAEALDDRRKELLDRLDELEARAAEIGATPLGTERAEADAIRLAVLETNSELSQLDRVGTAGEVDDAARRLDVAVLDAATPARTASPSLGQFIAGGALGFLVLGIFGHLAAARSDRRLRSDVDIAAVLDAPVLGAVEVPVARGPRRTGLRAFGDRLRRLVQADVPWDLPDVPGAIGSYDATSDARIRRLVARLRGSRDSPLSLVVVFPRGDESAGRAVARLAASAAADAGPVAVRTDCGDVVDAIRDTVAARPDAAGIRVTVRLDASADGPERTVLRVVEVDPDRPVVPEGVDERGAVVVLATGTRTAWEVLGIGQACVDAGLMVLGAVAVRPTRPGPTGTPGGPVAEPVAGSEAPEMAVPR